MGGDQTACQGEQREPMAEAMRGMDEWCAAHPTATFAELEQEVEARLAMVRAGMLAAAADRPVAAAGPGACTWCGGPLQARGQRQRQVRVRGNQPVTLTRAYHACATCGRGLFPPG